MPARKSADISPIFRENLIDFLLLLLFFFRIKQTGKIIITELRSPCSVMEDLPVRTF